VLILIVAEGISRGSRKANFNFF